MNDTPRIQQLSDDIANKIAAGEVIERPAAVIKELVENSIDAGATHIRINTAAGGHQLLEVSDDGHGMQQDDLRLALSRHATSKLQSSEDLFRIDSLGFRGEALPSIAGVSEFEIASRPQNAESGHSLRMMGSKEAGFAPCAMAQGTKVSVRNIFWNVPARLKFLKSEASESGHITDQVQRLALSHPHVAFSLNNGERNIFDIPQHDHIELRIAELFGRDVTQHLIPISDHTDTVQITGFITHPSQAKARAKRQFVFLNGRF
ncbi:MAG: DNA mismatch repair endonuclease MutL, partial [Planctomycetes bacterium]|nr:DNA mismatch repair endonuclease MutL [Planctomycetota bacterium]